MNRTLCNVLSSAILLPLLQPDVSLFAKEIAIPIAPDNVTYTLPASDGPYSVGVRSFYWVDKSRSESGLPADGGHREISITAWFPAADQPDHVSAIYAPGIESILAAADVVPQNRKQFILAHEPFANVASNSMPGVDPLQAHERWPVVLFSPGGNVSRHFQTALAERVASQGFVFVAMSHPFSSLDVAPESGFSMSREWDLDNEDRQIADRNDNQLADILATDAEFVVDQLRDMAKGGHLFATRLKLDRVGIAGHSRGGKTVGRACSSSSSFKACVVLDNIGPARERITGIAQPFLTIRAEWSEDRMAELHDYLGRTGSISHDVVLKKSNHFSCTDVPLFVKEVRAENFEPVEGIDACAKIVTGFLTEYLSYDESQDGDWLPEDLTEQLSVRRFHASPVN